MADIIDFEDRRKKKLDGQGTAPTNEDLGLCKVDSELQGDPCDYQNGSCALSNALPAPGKKPTQAEQLIQLAHQSATFFRTSSDEPFGCITVGDHQEIWPLRSKPFRMWLLRLLYESIGKMPHNKALEDASTQLQGNALFNGPCHEVFIRFASHGEAIYLDMADDKWDQIEITKQGWEKVTGKDSPIKFMRTPGMLPIANPSQQGSIRDLAEFLNLESQTEFQLIVGWLIGATQPNGPFPILLLQGEQGSAKSTIAKLLLSIISLRPGLCKRVTE
jgi:hypothetical protein